MMEQMLLLGARLLGLHVLYSSYPMSTARTEAIPDDIVGPFGNCEGAYAGGAPARILRGVRLMPML